MDVLKGINEFQLDLLPGDWVNSRWKEDFVDEKEVPEEYILQMSGADFNILMKNLSVAINGWRKGGDLKNSSSDFYRKSWQTLIKKKVNYKALVALLSSFLNKEETISQKESRSLAFSSSKLYFALLSIPGSLACNVFSCFLFEQALKTLINAASLLPKRIPSRAKGRKRKSDREEIPNNESDDSSESTSSDDLSEKDILEILLEICSSLDGLSICLDELHLSEEGESLLQTVQALVKLTQLECSGNVYRVVPKSNTVGEIVLKSYKMLESLCNPDHGEIEVTIRFIMRSFLPTLVINEENIKIMGKVNVTMNENTYTFIGKILRNFKDDAIYGVKAVVQQLCVRMPDRADIRAKAIPQIIQILELFPYEVFESTMQWIVSLAHSESVRYRLCAIELISKLLNVSDLPDSSNAAEGGGISGENRNMMNLSMTFSAENSDNQNKLKLLYKFLLSAILSRSLDASPVLRSKCLNIFATLILSHQSEIKQIMQETFVVPYDGRTPSFTKSDEEYFDFPSYFDSSEENDLTLPDNSLPSGQCIMHYTELLTKDVKVFVRKNALQLIANVCLLNKYWLSSHRLEILTLSSRDISLMIRKLIVKCLTDIMLLYPENKTLVQSWVQGVVSLIADSDIKCQEKAIESIRSVILENLDDYEKTRTPKTKLPWIVLSTIALAHKRILFKFACRSWSVSKCITKKTFKCLRSHIGTENNFAAWFFIVCLTEFEEFPSPRVLVDYFFENIYNHEACEVLSQLVVEAIFLNWKNFDPLTQNELYCKLRTSVESFLVPLFLISRYMDICFLANKNETKLWSRNLVSISEAYLRKYIGSGSSKVICEETLRRCILTLGDAAHFHPGVDFGVIYYIANVISPNFIFPGVRNINHRQDLNERWSGSVSDIVKAVAVVTLGKICLQDHFIAKRYAQVFANVLDDDSGRAVKINAMAALSDLCVRFTSVVEENLGDMCVMLKDDDIEVRTHSLKLILQLIQEDYLKPKGALFFYLLIVLQDPALSVREIIYAFFTNMLLKRNQSIMCHYFIQALFFFNDYEGAGSFNKDDLSAKEKRVFCMAGATNFHGRGQIYRYMLSNMRDDHRFKLSNRICMDILDKVNKGKIALDRIGVAVLKDGLYALSCEEMRLENMRKVDDDSQEKETDEIDLGEGEAVLGIAKKVFISQIVKANYVECIVPTISKLKHLLTKIKSPLVRDLMLCLRALMKDFRTEISDILHSDPELAAEVALDLKNVSQEEDPLSDPFGDFNIREVRVQCEQLSEKALCEKMGIVTPMKSLPSQSVSLLRHSTSLVAQMQLTSSMQHGLLVNEAPSQSFGESSGLQPAIESSRLQSTSESSGLQSTSESSGLQSTSESSGLQSTSESSGLQSTSESSGLQSTSESSGSQSVCESNLFQPICGRDLYERNLRSESVSPISHLSDEEESSDSESLSSSYSSD